MAHDATKVLLGHVKSSFRSVTCEPADPATFLAGLACRRKSDGGLELADDNSTGLVGISLGADLSNGKKTALCRKGLGVPLRQKGYYAAATITISNFTNAQGDTVTVGATVFTGQSGAATPGDATFQAASSLAATATSLAAQINAHAVASLYVTAVPSSATVVVTHKVVGPGANTFPLVWTDVSTSGGSATGGGFLAGGSYGAAVHGKVVYVNDAGLGCLSSDADAVATSGTYDGGLLSGVDYLNAFVAYVALVDMVGGL